MNLALPQLSCSSRPTASESSGARVKVTSLSWGAEPKWDQFVMDHSDGTIFHTLKWRNAVQESFGHEPHYLIAMQSESVVGVLPMFLVRGPIIGRMLVSVPYGVGGGMLVVPTSGGQSASHAGFLFDVARNRAEQLRCNLVDFRSTNPQVPSLPVHDAYVGFERELPQHSADVLGWLPRKARAVVRNAHEKYHLTCNFSPGHLRTVWQLYCRNMRRLGSINYPYRFFQQLAAEFGNDCWCGVVHSENRPIAGLLTLLFRNRVYPYFFGCETRARRCGAANFLYAAVMERAVCEGYRIFDFGRSRRDNTGSFDFKRFHGFEPRPLGYQRLCLTAEKPVDLTPTNPGLGLARRIWPHLPLAFTRPAGAFLSQYIPG